MERKFISTLLLGILLLFQSCQVQISNDRRILITGNIVDSSNNPLSNISVRCGTKGEILGETVSDANGHFQFTSLESDSYYSLDIMVNLQSNAYDWGSNYNTELIENTAYSAKHYYVDLNDFRDREKSSYNLRRIELKEPAELLFLLNNIPGDNNTLSFILEYEKTICEIDLNSIDHETCLVIEDTNRQLDENSSNTQFNLKSQLGTTVIFKYILNNDPEQTISIPLTNSENTYVFEY